MAAPARALTLPDHPEGRVSDYAHVLTPDARARLDAQLAGYAQGTTRQIAVATFPGLDGEPIEDASMRLAEKWKIGGKKDSDGVLVTLWIHDHMVRIEVGYGLEGKLPDAVTAGIIRDVMAPHMRDGDYFHGLSAGVAAIDTVVSGRAHPEGAPPPPPPPPPKPGKSHLQGFLTFGFWFMVIFFVIVSLIRPRGGGSNQPPPPGKGGGGFGGFGGFGGGLGAGWFLGGGGGWSSGSWGSGGGGGGFSGGGGSFGGGGASGSW